MKGTKWSYSRLSLRSCPLAGFIPYVQLAEAEHTYRRRRSSSITSPCDTQEPQCSVHTTCLRDDRDTTGGTIVQSMLTTCATSVSSARRSGAVRRHRHVLAYTYTLVYPSRVWTRTRAVSRMYPRSDIWVNGASDAEAKRCGGARGCVDAGVLGAERRLCAVFVPPSDWIDDVFGHSSGESRLAKGGRRGRVSVCCVNARLRRRACGVKKGGGGVARSLCKSVTG